MLLDQETCKATGLKPSSPDHRHVTNYQGNVAHLCPMKDSHRQYCTAEHMEYNTYLLESTEALDASALYCKVGDVGRRFGQPRVGLSHIFSTKCREKHLALGLQHSALLHGREEEPDLRRKLRGDTSTIQGERQQILHVSFSDVQRARDRIPNPGYSSGGWSIGKECLLR